MTRAAALATLLLASPALALADTPPLVIDLSEPGWVGIPFPHQTRAKLRIWSCRDYKGDVGPIPMLSQAIPPAYGEFIGRAALHHLAHARAA